MHQILVFQGILLVLLVPGDFLALAYRGRMFFIPTLKSDFLLQNSIIFGPEIKFGTFWLQFEISYEFFAQF